MIYPLPEVLRLVLCAMLAEADDFVEAWGEEHLGFLRRFLPYADGIPSHDTLNDVMNARDADLFAACFTAWVENLREAEADLVALDSKTARRTHAPATRCTWSQRGRAGSAWSWVSRRPPRSRTRSSRFPCCWNGWPWPALHSEVAR